MPSGENDGSELSVFDDEIVGGSDFSCGSKKKKSTPTGKGETAIDFTVGKHEEIVFSSIQAMISEMLSSEIATKHVVGKDIFEDDLQFSSASHAGRLCLILELKSATKILTVDDALVAVRGAMTSR
ncbi:myo-inositol-1-phosphate synthase 2 [Striga asiatica]|uniref:Myo-inositol-1-phosphate synthase 2 n=1 Tax=Striga asiatica TaxID=4170 RepID=A0A5A7QE55_STRAF|nr:myo-inositol-1-phosphate synthase 2 [Striga asiatica]